MIIAVVTSAVNEAAGRTLVHMFVVDAIAVGIEPPENVNVGLFLLGPRQQTLEATVREIPSRPSRRCRAICLSAKECRCEKSPVPEARFGRSAPETPQAHWLKSG